MKKLIDEIHKNAIDHGLWEKHKSFPEIASLLHCEVSEALMEHIEGNSERKIYFKNGKPEGVPIELADVIILIFSYCKENNIDIESAIILKHNYNKSRPYKHGKEH